MYKKIAIALLIMGSAGCGQMYRGEGHIVSMDGTPISAANIKFDTSNPVAAFFVGSVDQPAHGVAWVTTDVSGRFVIESKDRRIELIGFDRYMRPASCYRTWVMDRGVVQGDVIVVRDLADAQILPPKQ